MARLASIVGALTALVATPVAALTVSANVSATLLDATTVQIVQGSPVVVIVPMGMPSVRGSTTGALFVGNMPSMGMGGIPMMGMELLTVRRDTAESAAVTAPGSFMVMKVEGADSMMLRTSANADFGVMGDGVLMGGALMGGWATSVDVGRAFAANQVVSAPSVNQSTLVVVVQYN